MPKPKRRDTGAVYRKERAKLIENYYTAKAAPYLKKALEAVIKWRVTDPGDRSVMPVALFHQCMTALRMAEGRHK